MPQPVIDCAYLLANNLDICAYLPSYPELNNLDCDGGGVSNAIECANGTDPSNPNDDVTQPVIDCAYIAANGLDVCDYIYSNPTLSLIHI